MNMPIEIMKVYWSTDLELQTFSNNFNRAVLVIWKCNTKNVMNLIFYTVESLMEATFRDRA